ncbi:MAG: DNA-binding protein, partial [Candidatus Acidoferrum typicum]|nr:DNA-binding protein [Candidatus Acidoferrum typicum]
MSVDDVLRKLESQGLILKDKKRNGNDTGYQLRFTKGEIVNVFDNGTVTPQGKYQGVIREMLGIDSHRAAAAAGPSKSSRKVFVVYGHD